jgi:tRNA A-37 threonylcarbamoyl transferase component Bud32/aryl carrier-like protein
LSCSSASVLRNGTSNFGEIEESVSFAEQRVISEFDLMAEEENLCSQLARVEIEADQSRIEAFAELSRRKILESEASDVISKVKALEATQAREAELREAADMELRTTIVEQEKLLEEREAIIKQLNSSMRNISLLDVRAKETNRRCEEAAGELKLVQTSITALKQEKNLIRRQKMEAMSWVDRWKTRGQDVGNCEDLENVLECSLADLQTATCDFSQSFRIGQGEHGCVYKGEIFDRTIAIKQLHPHNMQGQSEFLQQVQLLGKIQHPNLVSIIGTCPEAWAVIYEYLPNGNLQHHLFQKRNNPLNWKIRARIIAQIANALLHLHSKSPNIIHGDLKPENILFDSQLNCKISDYGISRLVPTETLLRCPSFRQLTEPKGVFCYTDPEFRRTGKLTAGSDLYSFGLIVLQVLTGRPPAGLAVEVRRAVSGGGLPLVLAGEWPTFVANRLVEVGLQCCEANGRDRLELNAGIVRELEKLHILEELVVPSFFICPIRQVSNISICI